MKKLALAVAVALAASPVLANESNVDISELSSTADAPVLEFELDQGKRVITGYAGAELGGDLLLGDQLKEDGSDKSFHYWNMFKVGGDVAYNYTDSIAFLLGGEARFAWGGEEFDQAGYGPDENTDVDRFTFGIQTVAGTTKYGRQCGIADVYAGFGDLSKEHGVGGNFDDIACTENMLDHQYKNDRFHVGASYDHDFEAYAVGGSVNVGPVVIGGTYAIEEEPMTSGSDKDTAYTVGAVLVLDKLNIGAHISNHTMEHDGSEDKETDAYAVGASYQATEKLSFATTYNMKEFTNNDQTNAKNGDVYDEDKWFTVGAAYKLSRNLEFVTDYKVGSEEDDKLFLRANVNF